jgi:hypothetical protein
MPEVMLPGRIEGEIAFTEKWAIRQGALFYGLTVFKILAAGSIPLILAIMEKEPAKIWSGILGGLVAIVETFTTSFSLKQRFMQKRLECEALKTEESLYRNRAGAYARAESPDVLLVERTEGIIAKRIQAWAGAAPVSGAEGKKPNGSGA